MASGKAMANTGLGRRETKAELEAKLRDANALLSKIEAKVTEINKNLDKNPTVPWWHWYPYAAAIGLVAGLATGFVIWLFGLDAAILALH